VPLSSTALENRVVALARETRDELVTLVSELVACDTTARKMGNPPRGVAKLQRILASRLRTIGAQVDLFEPDAIEEGNHPFPARLDFDGRPQFAAVPGSGGGRSLLLNGHIGAVNAEHGSVNRCARRSATVCSSVALRSTGRAVSPLNSWPARSCIGRG
jgi:hypothetical protein